MEEIINNQAELEELFEEKFEKLKIDDKYKKEVDEYDNKIKNLFESLTQNQINNLDDILSCSNDLSYQRCKSSFILGFKTATRLIIESLKEQ